MVKRRLFFVALLCVLCSACITSGRSTTSVVNVELSVDQALLDEFSTIYESSHFNCYDASPVVKVQSVWQTPERSTIVIFEVPNYLCGYHYVIIAELTHDSQWLIRAQFHGVIHDIAGINDQLVISAGWEVAGSYPFLIHSADGETWRGVKLPKERRRDCCFDSMERLWQQEDSIILDFPGTEEIHASRWIKPIDEVFKDSSVPWEKINYSDDRHLTYSDSKRHFQNTSSALWQPLSFEQEDVDVAFYRLRDKKKEAVSFQLISLTSSD